jgi:hypothetical protein
MTDFPAYKKCSILQTRNITYSAHTTMTDPTPNHQKPAFEAEPTGNRLLDITEWNLGAPHGPTPNRPPLWRVMDDAYSAVVESPTEGPCYAAELRAIADWLVPEEEVTAEGEHYQARQIEREYLREVLLDEARRAEAGE